MPVWRELKFACGTLGIFVSSQNKDESHVDFVLLNLCERHLEEQLCIGLGLLRSIIIRTNKATRKTSLKARFRTMSAGYVRLVLERSMENSKVAHG